MQDQTTPNKKAIYTSARPHVATTSGGSQACAACKYQRRKCEPNCVLARHFPPTHQKQFLNAHKLFGVSNIQRVLKKLRLPERDIAANTMIFEATARANDPVGGCYRIICNLQNQINHLKSELDVVLHQLALVRARTHEMQNPSFTSSLSFADGHGLVNVDPSYDLDASIYKSMQFDSGASSSRLPGGGDDDDDRDLYRDIKRVTEK